jgi:hypothetical protein
MALLKFLQATSESKETLSKYLSDPEQAMNEAGLNEAEKESLRSGDRAKISALVEPEAEAGAFLNVGVTVLLNIS